MNSLHSFLFSIILFCFSLTESADPSYVFCNENTPAINPKISANIDILLPKLVSDVAKDGFVATSYGKVQDQVFGLAQCRGDVSKTDCSSCIRDAAKEIRNRCPSKSDARLWYEYCALRYNVRNFFGELDTSNGIIYYNVENVTDPNSFEKELGALADRISSQAVKPRNKGLGKGKIKLSPFFTLYALVQCTRDLSRLNCAQCLAIAIETFATTCNDRKGCRVIYSSCYIRYELYPFYFPLDSKEISAAASAINYQTHIVSRN